MLNKWTDTLTKDKLQTQQQVNNAYLWAAGSGVTFISFIFQVYRHRNVLFVLCFLWRGNRVENVIFISRKGIFLKTHLFERERKHAHVHEQ